MLRIVIILICSTTFSFAQKTKLILNAKITATEKIRKPIKNAFVKIEVDGQLKNTLTLKRGFHKFLLDTGHLYKITYFKEHYYSKHIEIDTRKAPKQTKKKNTLKVDVGLILRNLRLDLEFLTCTPIGRASFDFITEKLDWNYTYQTIVEQKIAERLLHYSKAKQTL